MVGAVSGLGWRSGKVHPHGMWAGLTQSSWAPAAPISLLCLSGVSVFVSSVPSPEPDPSLSFRERPSLSTVAGIDNLHQNKESKNWD